MNNFNKLNILVIGVLIVCAFLVGKCSNECDTETIETKVFIPEKSGTFETVKDLKPIVTGESSVFFHGKDTIHVPNKINQELVDKYLATKEELERIKMYSNAVSVNTYKTNFNNKDLDLTITSKTQGILLEVTPEYVIKSQTLTVPVDIPKPKEKVFSMNVGGGLSTTKQLEKFEPSVHLDFVNKKGNILSASYGTEGTIQVKYSIPLFSIKK